MPVSMETPNNYLLSDLNDIKEYKLFNNEKEYLIQIGKTSNKERLGLKIKEASSNIKFYYEKYFNLKELQNINKAFRRFDSIDEAFTSIDAIFQSKNASIIIRDDNNLCLNFEINQMLKGKENIEIYIEKKLLSLKEINLILEQDVKNMKIELENVKNNNNFLKEEIENIKNNVIKSLKEDIENMKNNEIKLEEELKLLKEEKNKIDELKKEIESLKSENETKNLLINEILERLSMNNKENINEKEIDIQNNLKDSIKEINEIENIDIDSEIINKKEELDFIVNRLELMEQFKNKHLKYNLLFRGTKDGKSSLNFHNKVDGKDKTIAIIETTKGLKFGGYIDKKWDDNSGWICDDENCFIFSISLKKIYNPIKGERKYFFHSKHGPTFSVFGIKNNLFSKTSLNIKIKDKANERFSGFTEDYELTGGDYEFIAKEIEIFQIEIQ